MRHSHGAAAGRMQFQKRCSKHTACACGVCPAIQHVKHTRVASPRACRIVASATASRTMPCHGRCCAVTDENQFAGAPAVPLQVQARRARLCWGGMSSAFEREYAAAFARAALDRVIMTTAPVLLPRTLTYAMRRLCP